MTGLGPERQHEAGDSILVDRHPMVRGSRVKQPETLAREWGEHLDELLVQVENRREVVSRGRLNPHPPSIAAIPALQEEAALIAGPVFAARQRRPAERRVRGCATLRRAVGSGTARP